MSGKQALSHRQIEYILNKRSVEEVSTRLLPNKTNIPRPFTPSAKVNTQRTERHWRELGVERHPDLTDEWTLAHLNSFQGNIENCIGTVKLPIGIVGPLRVNGLFASGDYPIPLATTEAALVASYHRGAALLSACGGCSAALQMQLITRSPAFTFRSVIESGQFVAWAIPKFETLKATAEATSNYARLQDVGVTIEGNHVYLKFEFTTGDASGQNMVTIATQAICDYIKSQYPGAIRQIYIEGNMSGDKKASSHAFSSTRGKKVTADCIISADLLKKYLHVTPAQMLEYWTVSAIGGVLSGTMGVHGHFANGLAALYIATGQDAACVAESTMGVTRFDVTESNDLYTSVTLPGIMVGTVGGGTGLPSQNACLELMNLSGKGKSAALAEVCAGLLLAGELSIIAALASGDFTKAHHKLARGTPHNKPPINK